ncbi:M28 family metallopeptidase [Actinokineospora enzanensis]|uniref:M28 family metallopeptidase n=1 Tax=Actinokineospora enzanensis TaxID=155975 RepID=UPI0003A5B0EC|nr:M28 family metallopeptidase [Actinokineospora enzanensis]
MPRSKSFRLGAAILAATGAVAFTAIPSSAAPTASAELPDGPALARNLVTRVTGAGANRHLQAFQRFADRTGGTRAAGTPGFDQSAEYVEGKLVEAGFDVTRQSFPFTFVQTLAQKLSAAGKDVPISIMTYSLSTPVGGVTAPLAVIPLDATPGCEATDYTAVTGKVVLVQRGGCPFAQKQSAAAEAGAIAVVIYNNVDGPLSGTLSDPAAAKLPTGGISKADGEALAASGVATVSVELRALREERTTYNVIAQTKTGRKDNVVMAGSHLDSVVAGPGINDNGSGSAALLETALQLGGSPKVNNSVRFAWWSAEELGLVGSTKYVQSLPFERQLDIALYLNFDMLASPNAGYFVYDGDNSTGTGTAGPYGSAQIEAQLATFLGAIGVPTEGSPFNGRSDYGEFIKNGIPAGGVATGAEGIKTQAQADKWGGQVGVAYDKCYHAKCDNLGNLDRTALDRNADAVAWAVASYAISTEEINGVPPRAARAQARLTAKASRAFAPAATGDESTS